MTKQELFDTVAKHLLTQKQPAYEDSMCKYRTKSGLKCAAGCLIPDDKYDSRIEKGTVATHADDPINFGWGSVTKHGFDNYKFFKDLVGTEANLLFLYELQKIHDNCVPSDWAEKLKRLAYLGDLEWKFGENDLTLDPNSDKV